MNRVRLALIQMKMSSEKSKNISNAISKIHNHSRNGCYLWLIKGNIKEEIYSKKLSLINMNYYSTMDLSYINDKIGYHRIINYDKYSYSLHFYHPKNHITEFFN